MQLQVRYEVQKSKSLIIRKAQHDYKLYLRLTLNQQEQKLADDWGLHKYLILKTPRVDSEGEPMRPEWHLSDDFYGGKSITFRKPTEMFQAVTDAQDGVHNMRLSLREAADATAKDEQVFEFPLIDPPQATE